MATTGNIYTDLSQYYDQFCAALDYQEQSAFARRVFTVFAESDGHEHLDLACGSGQHLQEMQAGGFTCSGLDNSNTMLAMAQVRCPTAQLLLCDLAAFDYQSTFDFITCFQYSMHYSYPLATFSKSLACCYAALKPGGVLMFNAVDAQGIKNDAGITTCVNLDSDKLRLQSGWYYRGEGEALDLNLEITHTSATGTQHWRDHHTMTALTFAQLESLLLAQGFSVNILEHDYSALQCWGGNSANAIFVACRN